MRKLIALLSSLVCLVFLFAHPLAAHADTTLPPGMVIGDSEGIYATPEGEYYVDLVNILPGESYEKVITIRSLDLEEPFSLGMLAEEVSSTGSVDWKEHITLVLYLDDKEIYRGPLLGDGSFDWEKTPLELGVCEYGTDKILRATFTTNSELTNDDLREKSRLEFYWTFVATKDQPKEPSPSTDTTEPSISTEPSTSSAALSPTVPSNSAGTNGKLPDTNASGKRLPQTGEQVVYMFLTGMLLILIALFLWKKRREEEQG